MKNKLLKIGLVVLGLLIVGGVLIWHFAGENPVKMKVSNQIISIGIEK